MKFMYTLVRQGKVQRLDDKGHSGHMFFATRKHAKTAAEIGGFSVLEIGAYQGHTLESHLQELLEMGDQGFWFIDSDARIKWLTWHDLVDMYEENFFEDDEDEGTE